ncbi:uncharacterized protein LOC121727599 [Aricia agestis]|uniref:uncharacterized protein LOC121727599 n=1 Tax=Aricia agestis TaxID=91739 RepID=UPI001C2057B9|nr:uncharacterized protein LOC121727599 [Aricia agestis]
MRRFAIILVMINIVLCHPAPLRVTIDCGSDEDSAQYSSSRSAELRGNSRFDMDSFCSMIQRAIPKAIKNGKFILRDSDQAGAGDTQAPVAVLPPGGFIPKLMSLPRRNIAKLGVPKLPVPKLRPNNGKLPPKVGNPMTFASLRDSDEEQTSAERMEIFKKGVQKMLHFVKVLGQIDQYLSERTRIIVDKLSKTFAD